jgi:hypothetical protein
VLELLESAARADCAPATHAILAKESGETLAVVYSADPADPRLELDLYAGSLVLVRGSESVAAPACRLTRRVIGVVTIELVEEPPSLHLARPGP